MTELQDLLLNLKVDLSNGQLPTIKEVWRAGDLELKLVKLNRSIKRIRSRWQVESPTERTGTKADHLRRNV